MRILKCITYLLLLLWSIESLAQQVSNMSLYHQNRYYLNSAVAGTEERIPININVRKQWAGFDGSPLIQTLNTHANIGRNFGVGGWFMTEVSGPSRKSGFNFSLAYRLNLSTNADGDYRFISFGLGGSFLQHRFEVSKMTTYEPEDLSIIVNDINYEIIPDANFGVYYKEGDKIYLGFSVFNLVQSRVDNYLNDVFANGFVRQYYLMGGASFDLGEDDKWKIRPSALAQFIEAASYQMEANLIMEYDHSFWFGPGYRLDEALLIQLGYRTQVVEFAYGYDLILNDLSDYSAGSHEVSVRINLFSRNSRFKLSPNF